MDYTRTRVRMGLQGMSGSTFGGRRRSYQRGGNVFGLAPQPIRNARRWAAAYARRQQQQQRGGLFIPPLPVKRRGRQRRRRRR